MVEQTDKTESIFWAALEIEAPQGRTAFLDEACGDDQRLREQIEQMLAAHPKAAGFLERPPDATLDQPITEKPGTLIGPYKLLQQIGEGGFGVVYMADQSEPVKRRVALKIIKPGMDTRQVVARFEAERQALAMMDHPNISKVFDAGATDSGRPYFVMELVKGVSITQFCDEKQLTPRQRLELFVPVCQALQHAHQKGIIHRDIKPSNVLVAKYGDQAVPKIIDFGIVKAIEQQLTEKTMFTQFGQIVGTIDYMSPEQAELNQFDVDTRSDIYSLGVLLYELLTGETPFDRKRLRSAAFDEMLRIIREEEPPKPSLRLTTSESLPSIAANRHIEPKKLSTLVRGELDWIVMKALEKDRTRRYETANGFARDIERYLNDEPVTACPPSSWYRLKKLARRNRAGLATTFLVAMSLLIGTGVSIWQALKVTEAHNKTLVALTTAKEARADAVLNEAEAKRQEGEAKHQEGEAKRQEAEAKRQRDSANFNSYLAEMRLAQQDWQSGQISRLYELLDRHLPQPDQPDRRGWEWYYLLSLCHKDSRTLLGHADRINSVAWSPDGKRLASASDDGVVKIWDAVTRQEMLTLPAGGVYSVVWSPDGERLASGSHDGTVKIWDATTGEELPPLRGLAGSVRTVAWSPDGRRLASGDSNGTVKIWDVATAEAVLTLAHSDKGVYKVAWSPDGERLASGENSGTLTIWDAITGDELLSWRAHEHDLWGLDWSPDGQSLATGSYDKQIKVFEASTGDKLLTIAHSSGVESVAWSPDGKRLASATRSQRVRVWDASTGKEVLTLRGHQGWVTSVAWSPDGRRLASGGSDRMVKIWDTSRDQQTPTPRHTDAGAIAWSPATDRLATAGIGGIKIWDTRTHQELLSLEASARFAWSPDGRRFAIESEDQTVRILDVGAGEEVLTFPTGSASSALLTRVTCFAIDWSPDAKRLAVAVLPNIIGVYDASTGREVFSLQGHTREIWAVRWSPDGRRLASAAWDGTVIIWDVATQQKRVTFRGHPHGKWLRSIAWSPDGTRLASGGWDQIVKIWDTSNGHELFSLRGHTSAIWTVAWSQHGERLATCSGDEGLKIWDMSTGQELLTLKEPGTKVQAVDWTPDGKCLASVSSDGTIKIFDASFGYEFAETATYRHERALGLAAGGRREEAITIFEKLAAEFPDVPDYRHQLARCYRNRAGAYHNSGESDKAIADYSESLKLEPGDAIVYVLRGNVYLNQKQYELALADCTEAIRIDPKGHVQYSLRAVAYYEKGEFDKASADSAEAIRIDPETSLNYVGLTKSLLKSDQMGKARELLEDLISRRTAALKSNPEDQQDGKHLWRLYRALAEVLLELGDYSEAAKAEEQAWDASPTESRNPVSTRSLLAACVALAEKDDGLALDRRQALIATYTDRIKELTELIEELLGPPYAPTGELTYIDLQPKANVKLTQGLNGNEGNHLAELTQGEHTFAGVKFRIADGLIHLTGKKLAQRFQRPVSVEGIQVNRKFTRLYVLHAAVWAVDPDGTVIGHYEARYEDNTSEAIPIVCGEDVRDWYRSTIDAEAMARGRVGWVGSNPTSRQRNCSLHLYVSRWENPHPEKKVIGIDFVSTNTNAAPFCVAMTVEEVAASVAEKTPAADLPGMEEQ